MSIRANKLPMIEYSFSSVQIAILACNILLILISLCFLSTKIMENVGYKLLALFVVFTALRLLFPFQFRFAQNIYVPQCFSLFWVQMTHHGNKTWALWDICKGLWILGIAIFLIRYLILRWHAQQYIISHSRAVTDKEPYHTMLQQICDNRRKRNSFQIVELPGIDTPMLYGIFRPTILLPEHMEMTEEELYCCLSHEACHHFHHDLLIKTLVKLITIAYWWNPFCILFNRQTDMILEMRVDDSLTGKIPEETITYVNFLLNMAEKISNESQIPRTMTMSFLRPNSKEENLSLRTRMLLSNQKRSNSFVNIFLCSLFAVIFILSYTFILEGYYIPSELLSNEYVRPTISNNYAIQRADNLFDVYIDGDYLDTVDSLEYFPENIPIYTEMPSQ